MTFEEFIKEWYGKENCITVQTSGSTGTPKKIQLTKDFVKQSAHRTIKFFHLSNKSRLHSCVSADVIGGKMMAVRALLLQADFTWETPTNQPLQNLKKNDIIDLLAVVPSQMLSIVSKYNSLPLIKNIIIGGSRIHPDLRQKIINSGLNAYETYGMTETASHVAIRKISEGNVPFKLLPGIEIELNKKNCLKLKFENGEIIETNDLAEIKSAHEFFIKGRLDNIINSGGRKINPFKIEEILSEFIPTPFCVCGKPDEKWGEKLILRIECINNDTNCIDLESLKAKIIGKLHTWEIPKDIEYVKSLPRTPNGKISNSCYVESGNNPYV